MMELERAESFDRVSPPESDEWPRGHFLDGDSASLGGCGTEDHPGAAWWRGPLGLMPAEGLATGPDEE